MGQIRIGIYDSDKAYTERFCQYMNGISGEMEFLPLLEKEQLDSLLDSRDTEAVLVPEEDREEYPAFIGEVHVGYLTAHPQNEPGEVFRYQSRRQILQAVEALLAQEDTSVKFLVFAGAGAGVGCSAAASAYAQYLSSEEKKVLYLNMNSLGDDSCIFRGDNPRDLQELLKVIAEKGEGTELLPSMLNRDPSGVYFYDNLSVPLSLMDVREEQMEKFFNGLIESGEYRYIIVDSSFSVNYGLIAACRAADKVFLVGDGTFGSNHILDRIWTLLENLHGDLQRKTSVLYNKFHKQYGCFYDNPQINTAGCMELLAPADAEQIVEELAGQQVLQGIMR